MLNPILEEPTRVEEIDGTVISLVAYSADGFSRKALDDNYSASNPAAIASLA